MCLVQHHEVKSRRWGQSFIRLEYWSWWWSQQQHYHPFHSSDAVCVKVQFLFCNDRSYNAITEHDCLTGSWPKWLNLLISYFRRVMETIRYLNSSILSFSITFTKFHQKSFSNFICKRLHRGQTTKISKNFKWKRQYWLFNLVALNDKGVFHLAK